MKRLVIRTAQMSKRHSLNDGLDITVKSGDKVFAPSWDMVLDYKDGKINEAEYTQMYLERMRTSYRLTYSRWLEVLNSGSVTFMCYCKPGSFCHRTILVELFQKMGERHGVTVVDEGEFF